MSRAPARDAQAILGHTRISTTLEIYTDTADEAKRDALTRLHDPATAERHFAEVATTGGSPITQARAEYWRGRTAETRGDAAAAQTFYQEGAKHLTTFYGQLSAEKAKAEKIEKLHLDEETFRWMLNEDQMATEQLSDGIRRFYADGMKLREYVGKEMRSLVPSH